MPRFTKALVVRKLEGRKWKVQRSFRYYIAESHEGLYVKVPGGFITDFASVPRLLWAIIPPDGKYTQAAVLHDYLYHKKIFPRKKSDKIFLDAMKILGVSFWKRSAMYRAVRMFGWIPWNKNKPSKK